MDIPHFTEKTGIPTVSQTMQIHQVMWTSERKNELFARYLSCSDCIKKAQCDHDHLSSANFAQNEILISLQTATTHFTSVNSSKPVIG